MNKFLTIFFAFLILGISCRDMVVYSQFKFDQDFIAAVLCMNKNKPAAKCNGKCYLKKKMEENHDEDSQIPFAGKERTVINLYVLQNSISILITSEKLVFIDYVEKALPFDFLRTQLQPPESNILLS
jgi:hypothetical protein